MKKGGKKNAKRAKKQFTSKLPLETIEQLPELSNSANYVQPLAPIKPPSPDKKQKKTNEVAINIYYLLNANESSVCFDELSEISRDYTKFGSSLVFFMTQLMGLGNIVHEQDITFQFIEEQFKEWLGKIENKPKLISTILFPPTQTKESKRFIRNLFLFLEKLFQDTNAILSNTPILEHFAEMIRIIGNSKNRALRILAVEFLKILTEHCLHYLSLTPTPEAVEVMIAFLNFNLETLYDKMKDVCPNVRMKAAMVFSDPLMFNYLDPAGILKVMEELINDENDPVVLLGINCVWKLVHAGLGVSLVDFCNRILGTLYSVAQEKKELTGEVFELLIVLRLYSDEVKIEARGVVGLVEEILKGDGERLRESMVDLLYITVFEEYKVWMKGNRESRGGLKGEQVLVQPTRVFETFIGLFGGEIPSETKIKLFTQIIRFDARLFEYNMLFDYLEHQEVVNENGRSKYKGEKFRAMELMEIRNMLLFVFATNKYITESRLSADHKAEKQQEYYTRIYKLSFVFVKEYIPRHETLADDYIRLFTALKPLTTSAKHHPSQLTHVFQYLKHFFSTYAHLTPPLIKLIISAVSKINPDEGLLSLILTVPEQNFSQKLIFLDLVKMNEFFQFINWEHLYPVTMFTEMMTRFWNSADAGTHIVIMEILGTVHSNKLRELLMDVKGSLLDSYLSLRGAYVIFLFSLLKKEYISLYVRQLGFVYLCELLSIISNTKLDEVKLLKYDITVNDTRSIYHFLYNTVITSQDKSFISHNRVAPGKEIRLQDIDYSLMRIDLSKLIYIQRVINLISNSIKFAITPYTSKFIITMFKLPVVKNLMKTCVSKLALQETLPENENMLVFWKLFRFVVFDETLRREVRNEISDTMMFIYLDVMRDYQRKKEMVGLLMKRLMIFFSESLRIGIHEGEMYHFEIVERCFEICKKRMEGNVVKKFAETMRVLPDTEKMRRMSEEEGYQRLRGKFNAFWRKQEENVEKQRKKRQLEEEREKEEEERRRKEEKRERKEHRERVRERKKRRGERKRREESSDNQSPLKSRSRSPSQSSSRSESAQRHRGSFRPQHSRYHRRQSSTLLNRKKYYAKYLPDDYPLHKLSPNPFKNGIPPEFEKNARRRKSNNKK